MSQITGFACPRCKKALEQGANFCANCGADISGVWGPDGPAFGKTIAVEVDPNVDTLGELLSTATLGEYDIYGELGRGGMAAVYLGLDLALNRKVAIKTMLPELVAREGMVERFKREAQTAAGLSHPHIIQIFTVKQTKQLVYFVMKFIEGRSLESVIVEKGPMDLHMAQIILSQVAGALAYAHRKHIVHRDIKPANVMIDEDGWAIVTDFGIAKVQEAQNLTATGTAIGTPHYMSPEQFHNKAVTGASDQYSLGIVAYEMLVGKKPFDGATYAEIITQHLFEPVPDLRALRPEIPEHFANAVKRMLAKDPAERFPDLDAAAAELGMPQKKEGDVVRTQMIVLAKNGPEKKVRMSVPMSPIPATRKPATATMVEKGATRAAATRLERGAPATRSRAPLWAAVAAVVVLGGGFAGWRMMRSKPAAVAAPAASVTPAGSEVARTDSVASAPARIAQDSTPAPAPVAAALGPAPTPAQSSGSATRQTASSETRRQTTRPGPRATVTPRVVPSPVQRQETPATATGLATLRLIGSPPATVIIDGVSKGEQSRISDQLIAGTHTLRVTREGWTSKDTVVTIGTGQTATIRIQLTERP